MALLGRTTMAELTGQIRAEVADEDGKLAELADALAAAGVNIRAMAAWDEGGRGYIMMVPDDCDKACQAIKGIVDKCECGDAVCVSLPNEAGALGKVSHTLSDAGIAIQSVYASAVGPEALVVLNTSDNAKAAELI